jgi:protein gp37
MGCDGCPVWSEICQTCYAGQLHAMRGGQPGYAPTFEQVTLFPGRMAEAARWPDLTGKARPEKPWLNGMPRLIFVSDMGDSLSKAVSFEYLEAEVIGAVTSERGRRHRWLWLTKRPGRMAQFSSWLKEMGYSWPANLWAGASVLDQSMAKQVQHLLKVGDEHTIRFLSVEPQLGPIDLRKWLPGINWVIQGGESGSPNASDERKRPREFKMEWAYDLKQQCFEAGVPYFLKQLGRVVTYLGMQQRLRDPHGGNWEEWPEELRIRKMPSALVPGAVV